MPAVLGYWKVRGLTAPIQYLLEHVGAKYEFKGYEFDKAEEWANDKKNLGLQFPNLPYYIDGDIKLTQSLAILKHLGRTHHLVGTSEQEVREQDELDGVIGDLILSWAFLVYITNDVENDKIKYRDERIAPILQQLDKHLEHRKYLLGDKLTYSDFVLFERLDGNNILLPGILDSYPNLKKFHQTVENLKGVKEYRQSPRFSKVLNGDAAKWNNK